MKPFIAPKLAEIFKKSIISYSWKNNNFLVFHKYLHTLQNIPQQQNIPLRCSTFRFLELDYAKTDFHGTFGHTIGSLQNIAVMRSIDISYTKYILSFFKFSPTLHSFQGINTTASNSEPAISIIFRSSFTLFKNIL